MCKNCVPARVTGQHEKDSLRHKYFKFKIQGIGINDV